MGKLLKFLFGRASREATIDEYLKDIEATIQKKDKYIILKERIRKCDAEERGTLLMEYNSRRIDAKEAIGFSGVLPAILVITFIDIASKFLYSTFANNNCIVFLVLVAIIVIIGFKIIKGTSLLVLEMREYSNIIQIIEEVNKEERKNRKNKIRKNSKKKKGKR